MNIALNALSQAAEEGVIERIQALPDAASQLSDKDYWGSVGIIALSGILVVFLILAILILFFYVLGAIFKANDKRKEEKKSASVKKEVYSAAPKTETAPVSAAEPEVSDNDNEIIAVISAAVAAYAAEEGTSYSIRSISRHKDNRVRSAWSMAGIRDNMNRQ